MLLSVQTIWISPQIPEICSSKVQLMEQNSKYNTDIRWIFWLVITLLTHYAVFSWHQMGTKVIWSNTKANGIKGDLSIWYQSKWGQIKLGLTCQINESQEPSNEDQLDVECHWSVVLWRRGMGCIYYKLLMMTNTHSYSHMLWVPKLKPKNLNFVRT